MSLSNSGGKHLVLAGAGHVHLTVLKNLDSYVRDGHRATVVSPSDYHYYSGMGPGLLSGTYRSAQVRFPVRKMVESGGGCFIRDKVVHIEPEGNKLFLESGKSLHYDLVSFNIGSRVTLEGLDKMSECPSRVYSVKPIENLRRAARAMVSEKKEPVEILVAGGGAAGTEISANAALLMERSQKRANITLVAGTKLLDRFDSRMRKKARSVLRKQNVNVLENVELEKIVSHHARLSDGKLLRFDFLLLSVGVKPPPVFKNAKLPTGPDGGLLVDRYLRCADHENIFGGGDCVYFAQNPLDKVGVYAVRQNPVLHGNLKNFLADRPPHEFVPQKNYLVILNLGKHGGLLKWKRVVLLGKWAFWLKDWIDKKFMRKFRVSVG